MNRYLNIVLAGALLNVLVLVMFPAFDVVSMTDRGVRLFDAFHPVWAIPPGRAINADILFFAIYGVVANALVAFMLLYRETSIAPRHIVMGIAFLNIVVVLLFPPFEAFPWAGRLTSGSFDGFYFAFGDKSKRSIFLPMLTLELIYVLINACAFWLAMGIRERAPVREPGPDTLLAKSDELRRQAVAKSRQGDGPQSVWVRGPDRRKRRDPGYKGPERRRGGDRRDIR